MQLSQYKVEGTLTQCAFAKRIVPHNLIQSAMHRIACECEVESRRCTELDLRPELGGVSKKQPDLAFSNFKSGATKLLTDFCTIYTRTTALYIYID